MNDETLYDLAKQVIDLGTEKGMTLALAESCTGGFISKCLTDVPGSSAIFQGGLVAYANEVKIEGLDIPEDMIKTYGAVSQNVADRMAENTHYYFVSDIALSVTGLAGPGGGSNEKPIGLVFMSIAGQGMDTDSYRFEFGAHKSRDEIRRSAVAEALILLSNTLTGL